MAQEEEERRVFVSGEVSSLSTNKRTKRPPNGKPRAFFFLFSFELCQQKKKKKGPEYHSREKISLFILLCFFNVGCCVDVGSLSVKKRRV